MKISCVVIVRNEEARIAQCIESLLRQRDMVNHEIIIVDGDSSDNTRKIVRNYVEQFNNIKLVVCNRYGYSYQRNIGVKHAEGDYILFLSGDAYLAKHAFDRYLDKMNEGFDIIQGTIINIKDDRLFSKIMREIYPAFYSQQKGGNGELFSTVNVAVRRRLFGNSQFDECLSSLEDKEWYGRISNNSLKFIHIKGAVAYHHIHESYYQYGKKIMKEAAAIGRIYLSSREFEKNDYFGWLSMSLLMLVLFILHILSFFLTYYLPKYFILIIFAIVPLMKCISHYPVKNKLTIFEKIMVVAVMSSYYYFVFIGILVGIYKGIIEMVRRNFAGKLL